MKCKQNIRDLNKVEISFDLTMQNRVPMLIVIELVARMSVEDGLNERKKFSSCFQRNTFAKEWE